MKWTKELYECEVTRERKALFKFAMRLAKNVPDAEDILQETLLRGWKAIEAFDGEASLRTWLFRIMSNIFFDVRRKAQRHSTFPMPDDAETYVEDPNLKSTEDGLVNEEMVIAIRQQIPFDMWEIMRLFHFSNLSYEEIAELKGLPIGTVKSRLNRARLYAREVAMSCGFAA